MATKPLGIFILLIICVFLFPVLIGLIGGAFGIVFGVFGAVFGVIGGLIGGFFGAIGGLFSWIFDGLFGWSDCNFFDVNIFTVTAIILLVVVLSKRKPVR